MLFLSSFFSLFIFFMIIPDYKHLLLKRKGKRRKPPQTKHKDTGGFNYCTDYNQVL